MSSEEVNAAPLATDRAASGVPDGGPKSNGSGLIVPISRLRKVGADVESATSFAYNVIRADILRAELLPHAKLRIEELASRYGVGPSSVREALNRLSAEGLATQKDQRGFRVAPISQDDLEDLTNSRCLLNGVLIRESVARGDAEWEESVVLSHHRLFRASRLPKGGAITHAAWSDLHKAFHRALVAGCGSSIMLRINDDLYDRAERYRVLARISSNQPRDTANEHRGIMQAAIDRDADTAVDLLNRHVRITTETIHTSVFGSQNDLSIRSDGEQGIASI